MNGMSDINDRFTLFDNHENLEKVLNKNGISRDAICVVGSSCLAVRNLRSNNDIDIIVNPEVETQVTIESSSDIDIRENGYKNLGISDCEVTTNIKLYDIIYGWKIIRPEIEYCHKKYKFDRDDIELLEEYRSTSEDWNNQLVEEYRPGRMDILTNKWFWKKIQDSVFQEGIWATLQKIPSTFVTMLRN